MRAVPGPSSPPAQAMPIFLQLPGFVSFILGSLPHGAEAPQEGQHGLVSAAPQRVRSARSKKILFSRRPSFLKQLFQEALPELRGLGILAQFTNAKSSAWATSWLILIHAKHLLQPGPIQGFKAFRVAQQILPSSIQGQWSGQARPGVQPGRLPSSRKRDSAQAGPRPPRSQVTPRAAMAVAIKGALPPRPG